MTFQINQEVFVINPELDGYGKRGKVSELINNTECGNLENDPMIVVSFDDGLSDGFWAEELSMTEPQARRPKARLYVHSMTSE